MVVHSITIGGVEKHREPSLEKSFFGDVWGLSNNNHCTCPGNARLKIQRRKRVAESALGTPKKEMMMRKAQ